MNIIIDNSSSEALYEQISKQIMNEILNLNIKSGEALPSIRVLAKELKVSIITTKRAYEELEKSGFVRTIVGKGTFVSDSSNNRLKEAAISEIENKLEEAIVFSKSIGLKKEELLEIFINLYEEV